MTRLLSAAAIVCLGLACGSPVGERVVDDADPPLPDMTDMETQVADRLTRTRDAILASPASAEAWGRFAMVAHAHELWSEAEVAYRRAAELDPGEVRWPYFLGDVLSVVGTDLEGAERAFRRAMSLLPDYGPAHMRLGHVLVAANRGDEAQAEYVRALELAPGLTPAQVGLAQIRLAQGDLDRAATLLEEVLDGQPRHGQALATLGQVYSRQGRREEAREIAGRARDAASYNLYEDPLMSEVVAEGISAVQLWERAKSFFDNGDYVQAALGLRRVAELMPDNPDVHHQLAVAYGNLGEIERSRRHLERTVALDPEAVAARIQLALVMFELRQPKDAVPHLEQAIALAPEDPDAAWLLARALAESGQLDAGVARFESSAARGLEVPPWAHNEWGKALAQLGRAEDAIGHFETALAADPDSAQAAFYLGLALEGLGRTERAVESYCRSLRAGENTPAAARLRELGRSCP